MNAMTELKNTPCEDVQNHEKHPLKDGDVLLVRDFRVGLPSVFLQRFPYLRAHATLNAVGCFSRRFVDADGTQGWRHYVGVGPVDQSSQLYRGVQFEVVDDACEVWLEHAETGIAVEVIKIAHKAQAKGQGEMLMKLRCACGETTPMLSTAIHTAPLFQVCQELGWQLQLAGVDTIYKCPTCVEGLKQEVLPNHPLRDGNVVIVVQEPPVPSVPFSRTYFALLVTNCTQTLVAGEWCYTCAVYVDGSPVDVYRGEYFEVKTEGDRRYLKHPSGKVAFLVKALVRD